MNPKGILYQIKKKGPNIDLHVSNPRSRLFFFSGFRSTLKPILLGGIVTVPRVSSETPSTSPTSHCLRDFFLSCWYIWFSKRISPCHR